MNRKSARLGVGPLRRLLLRSQHSFLTVGSEPPLIILRCTERMWGRPLHDWRDNSGGGVGDLPRALSPFGAGLGQIDPVPKPGALKLLRRQRRHDLRRNHHPKPNPVVERQVRPMGHLVYVPGPIHRSVSHTSIA
jgi:hypothetical protein